MLDVCSWCPGLVDLRVRHLVDGCESRARSCARHVLSASCFSALVVRRPAMYGLVWGGLRAQADFRSIDWHLACCVVCSPCSVQQWARDRLGLAGACRAPTVCLARLPLALVQCRTSWQVVPICRPARIPISMMPSLLPFLYVFLMRVVAGSVHEQWVQAVGDTGDILQKECGQPCVEVWVGP